jgi:hypothetical protein
MALIRVAGIWTATSSRLVIVALRYRQSVAFSGKDVHLPGVSRRRTHLCDLMGPMPYHLAGPRCSVATRGVGRSGSGPPWGWWVPMTCNCCGCRWRARSGRFDLAQLACGFVSAVDGRVDKIIDNTAVVRPTFMAAAPRIFEKAHARIVTAQQERGGLLSKLFSRAFAVGLEVDRRRRAGDAVSLALRLQHKLFDRLVFAKVRRAYPILCLGLGTVEPRDRGMVPRCRLADPGRLWPHRNRRRRLHQPAEPLQTRHRGCCLGRHAGAHQR